jgi:hypothetical protein
MAELNRLVSENLALVVGALALLLLSLLIVVLVQSLRLRRAVRAYRELVRGGPGGSLQEVIRDHIGEVTRVSSRLVELEGLNRVLEERYRSSIQHIGMVRFNPFDDTGSDQSFAIALLDDKRNGVVLSSLHGRTNTRLFAKPVEDGRSRHHLSDEEAQAIRIAVEGTLQRTDAA